MPQLLSRMDDISWLTPSIADILDQGAPPPGGDGSIREQILMLQQKLADLETPARIVNVRPTPSYTLFVARPDTVGRLGNRRPVTTNELKRSLGQIAEEHKEWKIGFLPQLQEAADSVGILLRTDEHKPLSLRRILVRSTFRDHPSTLAVVLGNTLEQKLIVQNLAEIGSLAVIGTDNAKQHYMRSLLLTLISMNTPGEMRLAVAGQSSEVYKNLLQTPHALGRVLVTPSEGQRLLEGLSNELQRRQQWFSEESVDNIQAYNLVLADRGKTILPRILLVIDALSDPDWQEARDEWIPALTVLLSNGGKAGIHLILAANQLQAPDIPGALAELITINIVMRSAAGNYADRIKNFHNSLMRFVDAFVVDTAKDEIIPVELCAVSNEEVQRTIAYWQQASVQRSQEANTRVSGKTGVTGILEPPPAMAAEMRARSTATQEQVSVADATATSTQTATTVLNTNAEATLRNAQALAAYLGWIGVGPLQDILGLSHDEALATLMVLRKMGVIEKGESPTPRFIRLSTDPQQ